MEYFQDRDLIHYCMIYSKPYNIVEYIQCMILSTSPKYTNPFTITYYRGRIYKIDGKPILGFVCKTNIRDIYRITVRKNTEMCYLVK